MGDQPVWEVVGGGKQGGIVVRSGRQLASAELPERLSTGALVRQLELHDERLRYVKLDGEGPDSGWVSLKVKNTELLKRKVLEPAAVSAPTVVPSTSLDRPAGSKMRILALHGQASNSKFMAFQTMQLKMQLGKDAEWFYVDGPMEWSPGMSMEDSLVQDLSDFEKRIAAGKPLAMWYRHGWTAQYGQVSEAFDCVKALLKKHEPIDVVLAFSQGSNLVSMLQDAFRREGTELPWRLNVFFCGGQIDDQKYALQEPLTTPTVRVYNSKKDDFFPDGEPSLKAMYTDLLEIPQEDGHGFPSTQPQAGEIYTRVVKEMRRHCGLSHDTIVGA